MQPPYFDSKTALDEAKWCEELDSTEIVRSNNNGLQCQLGWQLWEQPSDTLSIGNNGSSGSYTSAAQ